MSERETVDPAAGRPAGLRHALIGADRRALRRLLQATGFFHAPEVEVALELVDVALAQGESSGYHFVLADVGGHLAGYACFGPIACTEGCFDLYWIAVHPEHQGAGLGRRLLAEVERLVVLRRGRRVYVDTAGRAQYEPTRAFYRSAGYRVEAVLPDFYAPGDDKVILARDLSAGGSAGSAKGPTPPAS